MSKLVDCLSTLSVIASRQSRARAGASGRAVIDNYLLNGTAEALGRLAALRALYDGYLRLQIDNEAFDEIQADIEARIVELTVAMGGTADGGGKMEPRV
jgi:hypothetical protein